jgi:hypothetical protein
VPHQLLAKAHTDASRFRILPGETGFILWRQSDHQSWTWFRIAHMADKEQLEEIACEKLARLTE